MKRGCLKAFKVFAEVEGNLIQEKIFAHSTGEIKKRYENEGTSIIKIEKTKADFSKLELRDALNSLPEGGDEIFMEILNCCDIFGGDN